jgi:maltooligosyltrehalose trehalohydrolase
MSHIRRRYPAGAETQPDGSTHFRVWAPEPRQVLLRIEAGSRPREIRPEREGDGYYAALVDAAGAGTRYR